MVAVMQSPTAPRNVRIVTEVRGAAGRLFTEAAGEIIISGSAGTGKTRQILEYIHRRCATERIRALFLRKTLESLKASALVTYQEQVLHDFDGKRSLYDGVEYFGGNSIKPSQFTYLGTRSVVILGGMDRSSKVLSTEYDIIYVNECTELTLDEWEKLSGRTDRPRLDETRPPSVLIGDCNPDAPTHWILQRSNEGRVKLWPTTHRDNPAMWDRRRGVWTNAGERYLERLNSLTGIRRKRLLDGIWAAAEGQVYEGWRPDVHRIPPRSIPSEWPRYWVVDFGFVNPFVWQAWAQDPDGRLYRYREIYQTQRLVTDHAAQILALTKDDPKPRAIITDHDAEDRATLERALGAGMRTTPAIKDVSPGIQAVANRLANAGDGKPRLFFLSDALVEPDSELRQGGRPTRTEEEFDTYVWDTRQSRRKEEAPLKEDDHGMDAVRYLVAHFDLRKAPGRAWSFS